MGVLKILSNFRQHSNHPRIRRGLDQGVGQENITGTTFLVETRIQRIVRKKEDDETVKMEFYLKNGRVFLKKLDKSNSKFFKVGDTVRLKIYPDGIIRDICPFD